MRKFFLVQAGLLGLSALLIGILVDHLILSVTLSWIVVMTLITILNYLLQKNWVFARFVHRSPTFHS
jgi:putative flippase GtrA